MILDISKMSQALQDEVIGALCNGEFDEVSPIQAKANLVEYIKSKVRVKRQREQAEISVDDIEIT